MVDFTTALNTNKFPSVMPVSRKNKLCLFLKGKYLEKYMVLNMKMENGKVGRIEN